MRVVYTKAGEPTAALLEGSATLAWITQMD